MRVTSPSRLRLPRLPWRASEPARERIPLRTIAARAATLVGALMAVQMWIALTVGGGNPADAAIYYGMDLADPYSGWVVGGAHSFQYAPAFAQVMALLQGVPFDLLVAVWRAAALALIVWMAGPLTVPVLMWGPAVSEVNAANVNIFIAAAIAAGFRYPGTWSFVLLTKITPSVGLLWFVVRREWAALHQVALVTGAIVGVSFLLAPGLWVDWVTLIATHTGDAVGTFPYYIPLIYRLPIAIAIVVIGARFGWKATVAIAATVAAPVLYFPTQAILIGSLPPIRETAARLLGRATAPRAETPADQPSGVPPSART